jgi:metal-responsive CopG/Arc/MetJ family transcriptional regulator
MRIQVSLPDEVFHAAEHLAKRLGISRSSLYARALEAFVGPLSGELVTGELNRVYETIDSRLAPDIRALQSLTLLRAEW